jgi:hypothetical protein
MARDRGSRIRTAIGLQLAIVGGVLGLTWVPVSAGVTPAGSITLHVVGGEVNVNSAVLDDPIPLGCDQAVDPTCDPAIMSGDIDQDGNVVIPQSGVVFPLIEARTPDSPVNLDIQMAATGPSTGIIDPAGGTASINVPLQAGLLFNPGTAGAQQCSIALNMGLTGTYDAGTGVAVLNDTFDIGNPAADAMADPAGHYGMSCAVPALIPFFAAIIGLPAQGNSVAMTLLADPRIEDDPTVPTTTPTTTPEQTYLDAASSDASYTCAAADAVTQFILDTVSDGEFTGLDVVPTIRMEAIAPSPAQGSNFSPRFSMLLKLPTDLVGDIVDAGINQAEVANLRWRISPIAGVSGSPLVGTPPSVNIALVKGQIAQGQIGPVSKQFTRTSAIGEPVSFRSDDIEMTIKVTVPAPIGPQELNLTCEPKRGNVLAATDKTGTPPEPPAPPQQPAPPATQPGSGAPGEPGGPGGPGGPGVPAAPVDQAGEAATFAGARGRLPSTGAADATQTYVLVALGVLAVGFVLSGADASPAVRRRRT